MGRYRGPMVKLSKRLGLALTPKCERHFALRNIDVKNPNHVIGSTSGRRKKLSTYGVQLWEKQKLQYAYGIREKQIRKYFEQAKKAPVTGDALMQILESRFDNVVFRMGFAASRAQARQMIVHGHFTIDGKKAKVPSIHCKPGAIISVKENSKIRSRVQSNYVDAAAKGIPTWVKVDSNKLVGELVKAPSRDEIDMDVEEQLVVEYYSR